MNIVGRGKRKEGEVGGLEDSEVAHLAPHIAGTEKGGKANQNCNFMSIA